MTEPVTVRLAETTPLANPFPGLRPFREEEEHLFFGRERQVDSMIDKLAKGRFLAVVGTSGSGKSSLVNCGLRPALHRGLMTSAGSSWRIAQFRPGSDPIDAMARALAADGVLYSGYQGPIPLREIIETHLRLSSRGLLETFRKARLSQQTNLLVIADQFEELFRYRKLGASQDKEQYGAGEQATAFVNLLLAPQESPGRIYVVLTMRSDFLGDCAQFHGLPEAINEGQFLVPRMTREERRAAIAGPVGVARGEIDTVLLTRLVNDVGDNPDQLSILQHALNRTWAQWQHHGNERAMGLTNYEAIGTMAHALDQHAEKAVGELGSDRQRRVCEKVFKALTDKGTDARGIRRPTNLETLCAIAAATPDEIIGVIDVFRKPSRSFLMPPLPEALESSTVIDISHESLMRVWERLRSWADEEAQSATMYRRLAETAALHAAGKAGLWGDPDLQLALDWLDKEQPTAAWADLYQGGFSAAMLFLSESKKARNEELAEAEFEKRWRTRWGPAGGIAILLLFLYMLNHAFDAASGAIANLHVRLREFEETRAVLVSFLIGVPFVGIYLGLERYGKRALGRIMLPSIVKKIAERPAPVVKLTPEPRVTAATAVDAEYAGFGRRALAYTIDFLIFIGLFWFSYRATVRPGTRLDVEILLLLWLGVWFGSDYLYQTLTIRSQWQATLGMKVARIFVTDLKGNRLSFFRASARHFAKLLSYYSIIGFFMPFWTKHRQALHDFIVKSVVLHRPKSRV